MKRAVPLGLVANELVTDCVKHAFPGCRRGTLLVALGREGGNIALEVADDGVGLPEGFDPEDSSGLGMTLVSLLCRQTGADFSWSSGSGTGTRLRVVLPA